MTKSLTLGTFEDSDMEAVISLWQKTGLTQPRNDPEIDIRFAMAGPSSTVLVGRAGIILVGSVMVGHDGHRGTVYYLAIDPDHRKSGFGAKMLAGAEAWLRARGVWKLNLVIRAENRDVREFYLKCGYSEENRILMARRITKA
ncbi:Acetyltransferase [hydrothermal vent metagenome]|uniref:Acetyltransferase n=1 Tax=hydrothermal vent metagenome TaxID=652676 RepID=A0A3B0TER0_9ZZZZ